MTKVCLHLSFLFDIIVLEREVFILSKPRLKAVNSFRKSDDSWQHCCRWCHYFSDGKCWNKNHPYVFETDSSLLYAADMGEFSEVIEEVISYPNDPIKEVLSEINKLFDKWKISSKRRDEFEQVFEEVYTDVSQDMRTLIDEAILRKMNNIIDRNIHSVFDDGVGVEINNPSEFCCKEWC